MTTNERVNEKKAHVKKDNVNADYINMDKYESNDSQNEQESERM